MNRFMRYDLEQLIRQQIWYRVDEATHLAIMRMCDRSLSLQDCQKHYDKLSENVQASVETICKKILERD